MQSYDVVVIGGGNGALCAAIAARHMAPRVLLLERAPFPLRGGNTRHTRTIRCANINGDRYLSGHYLEDEFLEDLIGVTGGPANVDLAKYVIRESIELPRWMSEHGISWQQPLAGTLHFGRTNRWFLGGGKALLNSYYRTAEKMGVTVRYGAMVEDLVVENGSFAAALVKNGSVPEMIRGNAVVVAAGGFEANLEWLKRYWGAGADNFIVRGSAFNDGTVLAILLEKGAQAVGNPKAFHAIGVDARSPKYDGGIVTRLDVIPAGIVVNRNAQRFYDEGEDIWPKRYAIWGTLIANQPEQLAYGIVDSKMIASFLPPMFEPYKANSIQELAAILDLDPRKLLETIAEFNRGAAGNTKICIDSLDGNSTRGISPPKSNWALPIDTPPYFGMPLRPGITFTYMGVAVDETMRVLDVANRPFKNIFAAGEIMAGNILTKGYLGGFGLTIGSIAGRLAGKTAAQHANF